MAALLILAAHPAVGDPSIPAAGPGDVTGCFGPSAAFAAPARIDERNKRLFIVPRDAPLETDRLPAAFAELASCLRGIGFGRWKVSLFAAPGLAGYKDESSLDAAVRGGAWAAGYLGEYDGATRLLTLDPVTRPRVQQLP